MTDPTSTPTSPARVSIAAALFAAACLILSAFYIAENQLNAVEHLPTAGSWPATVAGALPWAAGVLLLLLIISLAAERIARTRRSLLIALIAGAAFIGAIVTGVIAAIRSASVIGAALKWDSSVINVTILGLVLIAPLLYILARSFAPPSAFRITALLIVLIGAFTTSARDLLVVVAVNAVAWAFGQHLLRLAGAASDDLAESFATALPLGIALLGVVSFGLGLIHAWNPWLASAALTLVAFQSRKELMGIVSRLRAVRPPKLALSPVAIVVVAAAIVLHIVALVAALAPEVYDDAVGHHLAMASRMATEHRLTFWVWMLSASANHGATMLAWGVLFATPVAGKVQVFIFGIQTVVAMWAICRRYFSSASFAWSLGIWSASSLAMWLVSTAYVDMITVGLTMAVIVLILRLAESADLRLTPVVGLLLGALLATKLSAYSLAVPLGFIAVLPLLRISFRRFAAGCGLVAGGVAIILFPWLARAWYLTGNPVFPVLNHIFGSPFIESSSGFDQIATFGVGVDPLALLQLPWVMAFEPRRLIEVGSLGPALLALPPLVLLMFPRRRPFMFLFGSAVAVTLPWAFGVQYLRWFTPAFAIWCVVGGVLAAQLIAAVQTPLKAIVASTFGAMLLTAIVVDVAATSWWFEGVSQSGFPHRVVFGREGRDEYLTRQTLAYGAISWINEHAPDAKVFTPSFRLHLYERRLFHHAIDAILPLRQRSAVIRVTRNPRTAWRELLRQGYEYLLLSGTAFGSSGAPKVRPAIHTSEFLSRFADIVYAHHGAYVVQVRGHEEPRVWPPEPNLLWNPQMERLLSPSEVDSWQVAPGARVDSGGASAHSGNVAVLVGGQGLRYRRSRRGLLATRVAVRPDETFILRFFSRSDKMLWESVGFARIEWLDRDGKFVDSWLFRFYPDNRYGEYFFADTSPPRAAQAVISLGGRDLVWIDDVSFSSLTAQQKCAFSSP